jgi:hypothetical protein
MVCLLELIDVMEVTKDEIATEMKKPDWRIGGDEGIDTEKIANAFLESVKRRIT